MSLEFLWYIPNTVEAGHRGDDEGNKWTSLDLSAELAQSAEDHGWGGALLGTGWGRPDTFTLATSLAARTTRFKPLIAIRPGYWRPAHFASAAATLDQLSKGRVLVNIVSGQDNLAAYGDTEGDQAERYARTREFMQIVRRLWTSEGVTFRGRYFTVEGSTLSLPPYRAEDGRHPRLYFGGASAAAEQVSAAEADVQLFWGEPLDGVAERIDRLKALTSSWAGSTRRWSSGCASRRWSETRPGKPGAMPRRRWPRWRRAPGRTSMTAISARPSARPGSST